MLSGVWTALLLLLLSGFVACQNRNGPPPDPNNLAGLEVPSYAPRRDFQASMAPNGTSLNQRNQGPCRSSGRVEPGNLTCYSCKLDFRPRNYQWNHPCLGRHSGHTVDTDYLVTCGPNDRYCRAERTEVNGILILLTRECTDDCYYGCRPKGFGINFESCAQCCDSHACNDMYPESLASLPRASHVVLSLFISFVCFCLF
ncbi:uncharacterized protein LOC122250527 [Penaeus japonicus]|uniref:uncharacterized protein LOC122250527 n=1 Tax=Penaeus japonicus TaxID=27405 RepID=UPI001C7109FE|nr:uncharacterized protein LOC122250527 [Penaeus japonicus]